MADSDNSTNAGVVDKRAVTKAGTASHQFGTPQNYDSVANMRTRLAAANAGYYTTARLNQMSKNDMMYALRLIDDPTGV